MRQGVRLTYSEVTGMFDEGQIGLKWIENETEYQIFGYDGGFLVETYVPKGSADAADFETNYKPSGSSILNPLSPRSKRPETIVIEPEGESKSIVTHNFADKTTWYTSSTQVVGETLTLDTGLIYDFQNTYLIDVTHGKVTGESNYNFDFDLFQPGPSIRSTYQLKVYDNGVLLNEGTDYTCDYVTGKVTLVSSPSGAVTSDYYYATNSDFFVPANTFANGTRVRHVELNFTKDIVYEPMVQEAQIYVGTPVNGFVTAEFSEFLTIYNLIDVGNEGKGFIPQMSGLADDVLVMPFMYGRALDLDLQNQTRVKLSVKNHQEMNGTRATATFYTVGLE